MRLSSGLLLLTTLLLVPCGAEDQTKKIVVDDPSQIRDPDYKLQGEYVGELTIEGNKVKHGAQVIALGNGKFTGVGYHGGLPGDGWNGERQPGHEGELENGQIVFAGENFTATVKDEKITITSKEGQVLGELAKVERKSPTLGAKPPEGALVLFDGKSADAFDNGKMTEDKLLIGGVTSKHKYQSARIHVEFRTPYQPQDRGQARGNSGVYVQGRWETQILDSFGLEGKDNECGGLYSVKAPDLNMCLPPLAWQTYDIDFTAAKYDSAGKRTAPAKMTVKLNGVVVHDNVEMPDRKSTAAPVEVGPEPGPLYLQDHGNPVRFRNVWIVETK